VKRPHRCCSSECFRRTLCMTAPFAAVRRPRITNGCECWLCQSSGNSSFGRFPFPSAWLSRHGEFDCARPARNDAASPCGAHSLPHNLTKACLRVSTTPQASPFPSDHFPIRYKNTVSFWCLPSQRTCSASNKMSPRVPAPPSSKLYFR